jgi:hypothetical protein
MPTLWGARYSKRELLRRVGRLEQVAGVRLVTLADGIGRGVRIIEFRTGTGFSFDVLVDRSFDVGRCEIEGMPLNWQSNPGVVAPWYYEHDDWGWFRSWGGGMVVTCGLDHTLGPGDDDATAYHQPHVRTTVHYALHGRVGGLPARLVGCGERWEGDECVLWAEGEVLQSSVYQEHLVLRRRIEARVGESRFTIRDEVENVGHSQTSHMLLYHCNAGFPVVDEGSRVLIPSSHVRTDYGVPVEGWDTLVGPQPDFTEACFENTTIAEAGGTVPVAVVNERLGLGVYQVYRREQLPFHTCWRMLGEDTYGLAMEPGTNRDMGRFDAKKRGELQSLEPGETRTYDLEIGALRGAEELGAFRRRVEQTASEGDLQPAAG